MALGRIPPWSLKRKGDWAHDGLDKDPHGLGSREYDDERSEQVHEVLRDVNYIKHHPNVFPARAGRDKQLKDLDDREATTRRALRRVRKNENSRRAIGSRAIDEYSKYHLR